MHPEVDGTEFLSPTFREIWHPGIIRGVCAHPLAPEYTARLPSSHYSGVPTVNSALGQRQNNISLCYHN